MRSTTVARFIAMMTMVTCAFVARAEGPLKPIRAAIEPTATEPSSLQPWPPDVLTLEHIMADPDWIGTAPEDPYWSDNGDAVFYTRKRVGEIHRDLWRLPVDDVTSPPRDGAVVDDAALGGMAVEKGHWSRDRQRKVYARAGDVFVYDRDAAAPRQLTRTVALERAPRFMADEDEVTFSRGDRVFVRNLVTGLESEVADFREADDPADEAPADDYLSRQQRRLFETVRQDRDRESARREHARAQQSADPTRPPLPWFLGKNVEIVRHSLSPAGDWLLLVVTDAKRDEGQRDIMPNYISDDGFVQSEDVRVKVGDGDLVDHRLLLLDLIAHEQFEIDLAGLPTIAVDPLAEIKAATAARRKLDEQTDEQTPVAGDDEPTPDAEPKKSKKKKGKGETAAEAPVAEPRPVEITTVSWTRDGGHAAVQVHSADNKDRWIGLLSRDDRAMESIHHLSDADGWINWSFNEQQWLDDGKRLLFLSEESGWSQLYLHDLRSNTTRRLTEGDFVVSNVEVSPDEAWAYYTGNPDHPGRYDVYRVALDGDARERITNLGGTTQGRLSPDGSRMVITHSTTTRPPELYVQASRPGATAERVTHTVSEAFEAIDWTEPEIVAVPSSHQSRPIYTRVYDPDPEGNGPRPAAVFVHGAGYLQNAHAGWSGYFREFMFHTLLNRAGYVVIDMDYRASRGYGRDWRTAIYRKMGTPEVEDLVDGVAWLVANRRVDRQRVGVYGGSYGGFLTFMAMFKDPDLFACGAALRPVTDWAHYNHPYTSNILNTPEDDPEAYERSSPIEFAAGLERPLLIASGMQDDNVFFQDSVRLVQRLIELEKASFELAVYPIEPHGFREPFSWLDEYKRIFALFEAHLKP